jgi:hypothetical protein
MLVNICSVFVAVMVKLIMMHLPCFAIEKAKHSILAHDIIYISP